MKPFVIRSFLSLPAAMFYCVAAAALHQADGSPGGLPTLASTAAPFVLAGSVALWVVADARDRHRPIPYDFGSFVFFTWPILVPIYLISTRGWRAITPLGCFVMLYLTAVILGSVPAILDALRP